MKGRHLKLLIVGVAVCYAAVVYGQDLMKTLQAREQRNRQLEPELNKQELPQERERPRKPPRTPPPPEKMPYLLPKEPVSPPQTAAQAAQYVRGERMESRVQGTLFLHQMKEKGLGVLSELLRAQSGRSRAAAVTAMGWILDRAALPEMVQLASDPDPWARRALGQVLGLYRGPEVESTLRKLSEDPDPQVRASAAESLGLTGDPRGAETLVGLLQDKEEGVRGAAALALQRVLSPGKESGKEEPKQAVLDPALKQRAVEVLAERLRSDPSPEVRRYAAEALGETGDNSVLGLLIERLGDENEDEFVQYGAALGIGGVGKHSKEAEMALRRAQADNTSALVQNGIYEALRRLKLTPAARPGEEGAASG